MRDFDELSECEKILRTLIYAIEDKDKLIPGAPFGASEVYLQLKLNEAKKYAIENGIPLVNT